MSTTLPTRSRNGYLPVWGDGFVTALLHHCVVLGYGLSGPVSVASSAATSVPCSPSPPVSPPPPLYSRGRVQLPHAWRQRGRVRGRTPFAL